MTSYIEAGGQKRNEKQRHTMLTNSTTGFKLVFPECPLMTVQHKGLLLQSGKRI